MTATFLPVRVFGGFGAGSEIGQEILDHFEEYLPKFKKVIPFDYEKMQTFVLQMEEKGLSSEQAKIEAFYAIKNGKE